MTYGSHPIKCSGNCCGWQLLWLEFSSCSREVAAAQRTFQPTPARDEDSAARRPHCCVLRCAACYRSPPTFSESSKHCSAKQVEYKIPVRDRSVFAGCHQNGGVAMQAIDRSAHSFSVGRKSLNQGRPFYDRLIPFLRNSPSRSS